MTTEMIELSTEQAAIAALIDALDLEPVVVKLIRPEPGPAAMTLAEADQHIALYRGFLKLCAWYPGEPIVPSTMIDHAWHTHILDTGKYAADCDTAFGGFLHHFPYLGMRGPDDVTAWQAAYQRTRELFRGHFGIDLPAGQAAGTCHNGGSSCKDGGGSICSNEECEKPATAATAGTAGLPRPRPDRTASPIAV
jgi:hypothetical protein